MGEQTTSGPTAHRRRGEATSRVAAITVRTAQPDDAPMLAELGARTFVDAYARQVPEPALLTFVTATFRPDRQAAELADPNAAFLVAEHDRRPVGYAYARVLPEAEGRVLHIDRLYAHHDWVGRGVGRALMLACMREAARRACTLLRLTVWTENRRAIRFYRRWGFVTVGAEPFRLGSEEETDLVMQRPAASVRRR